jgi:drug/metabolite transporter (DMT)-like permease
MSWFPLALLSAAIFAWVTVIDKRMVDHNFTDPFMYSLFIRIYGVISATVFVLVGGGWQPLPLWAIGVAVLAGVLGVGAGGLYFVSLTRGDAALISAVEQTRPLFALLWGTLFLGEFLDPWAYLGITAIVTGTVLLSLERDAGAGRGLRWNRVVFLMLLGNVFHTLAGLLTKVVLTEATPDNGYFWCAVGGLVTGGLILLFWPAGRQRMRAMLTGVGLRAYAGSASNEIIANVSGLILTTALARGPLAPVSTLAATQPLFIGLFVWLERRLRHDAPVGTPKGQALLPRWLIMILIIVGVYLLGI